jgi:hypothetical protein
MKGASGNPLLRSFDSNQGSLERLCKRILAGKVVFFVGAGFSLDSEGNSSWALIGRLIVRFASITEVLISSTDSNCQKRAGELRRGLKSTFALDWPGDTENPLLSQNSIQAISQAIPELARNYYSTNDWMCSAFTELVSLLGKDKPGARNNIRSLEISLLKALDIPGIPQRIDNRLIEGRLGSQAGKALFLDAMGFNNAEVMTGAPFKTEFDKIASSYQDRLRIKHFILARLAREGLCPTILTTNYDLLLDGACRLVGFGSESDLLAGVECSAPTAYRNIARIAEPGEFFAAGDGYRAALLFKIHGCVEEYRKAVKSSVERWKAYLPAMVFTFREVQNWRRDSWSRDLVRTLLRTRTIAFCGYSINDPVLNDTFRSVYEEMAEQRLKANKPIPEGHREDAPAFYFGVAGRREFTGTEILRAASHASGSSATDVTDHPNYLQFEITGGFPDNDDLMLWLYHRIIRQIQRRALETDLRRVAHLILDKPVSSRETETIRQYFKELEDNECATVASLQGDERSRFVLERICSWTYRFQALMLRELALGEAFLRRQGPGADYCRFRDSAWYYPATERQDWTAWVALVEIALRRGIAETRGKPSSWAKDDPQVNVAPLGFPAVFFHRSKHSQLVDMIGIFVAGFSRLTQPQIRGFALRKSIYWKLNPDSIPWPTQAQGRIPKARRLWDWATNGAIPPQDLEEAFGSEH